MRSVEFQISLTYHNRLPVAMEVGMLFVRSIEFFLNRWYILLFKYPFVSKMNFKHSIASGSYRRK